MLNYIINMPKSNTPTSHFKGIEAKRLAQKFHVTPNCIPNYLRSYTIPSQKTIKHKLITVDDIQWHIDQIAYLNHGKYVFSKYNITNELRYDTDNNNYTKAEFIEYYGSDNYFYNWNNAPSEPYLEQKKYDTDLNNYTEQDFIDYYGDDNYLEHWINAPTELP